MAAKFQVTILCVGRLRESFWKEAAAEYLKRLLGYTSKCLVIEIADEPTPDGASLLEEEAIREREGEKLLAKLTQKEYVIVCDSAGKNLNSVELSGHLERLSFEESISSISFVIGGSLGLSESVKSRASFALSFGKLTFPHQLLRVMLLEQLYRAFKIARGEPYHK